ncbi:MAG: hypothetical protein U5J97_11795 [Trueperaceae bacterium]|nr:hypothetical protein [Trueperaceae bacterium]
MNAAYTLLDGPLTALVRDTSDTLTPLTASEPSPGPRSGPRSGPPERALLAFSTEAAATAHLDALPREVASSYRAWTADAGDWRAKEELLRAGASLGAQRLDLDPDMRLQPAAQLPLERAIAYVISYKRNRACL